jgi:hypothetical protein
MNIRGIAEHGRVYIDGVLLSPKKSQALMNHSPDGFSWGYSGSGPAQLALAILLEVTDENTAVLAHQEFKSEEIAVLTMDSDFNVDIDVEDWVEAWHRDRPGVLG